MSSQSKQRLADILYEGDEAIRGLAYILNQEPFVAANNVDYEFLGRLYSAIKSNEVDQVQVLLSESNVAIAELNFSEVVGDDTLVLPLEYNELIMESHLNPVLLAINSKSFATFKALTSYYHIRTASHERDVRIPLSEVEIAHFSSLVLPLILKTKDVEALSWILRQDEILLRGFDFYSFVVNAIRENWL
jgi:hypothetical protein